jgi:hypothetical protein
MKEVKKNLNIKDKPNKDLDMTKKQTIFTKIKAFFKRKKQLLINMELQNGDHVTFLAFPTKGSFKYKDGEYIIDESFKYYNITAKCYALDYHENYTLPIKRTFPSIEIKKQVANSSIKDIHLATNPVLIRAFIESNIAEGVMKGQMVDLFLRAIKMWIIVGVIVTCTHFLVYLYASGIIDKIRGG